MEFLEKTIFSINLSKTNDALRISRKKSSYILTVYPHISIYVNIFNIFSIFYHVWYPSKIRCKLLLRFKELFSLVIYFHDLL